MTKRRGHTESLEEMLEQLRAKGLKDRAAAILDVAQALLAAHDAGIDDYELPKDPTPVELSRWAHDLYRRAKAQPDTDEAA